MSDAHLNFGGGVRCFAGKGVTGLLCECLWQIRDLGPGLAAVWSPQVQSSFVAHWYLALDWLSLEELDLVQMYVGDWAAAVAAGTKDPRGFPPSDPAWIAIRAALDFRIRQLASGDRAARLYFERDWAEPVPVLLGGADCEVSMRLIASASLRTADLAEAGSELAEFAARTLRLFQPGAEPESWYETGWDLAGLSAGALGELAAILAVPDDGPNASAYEDVVGPQRAALREALERRIAHLAQESAPDRSDGPTPAL